MTQKTITPKQKRSLTHAKNTQTQPKTGQNTTSKMCTTEKAKWKIIYLTTMPQQTWLGHAIWRHTQEIRNALGGEIKTGIMLATTTIAVQAITTMAESRLTYHQKRGLKAISLTITGMVIAALTYTKSTRTSSTQQRNGEQNTD